MRWEKRPRSRRSAPGLREGSFGALIWGARNPAPPGVTPPSVPPGGVYFMKLRLAQSLSDAAR